MSAASMATSVPEPIAMPTSACASAGASLMPSPHGHHAAGRLERLHLGRLAVGQHPRHDAVDLARRRDQPRDRVGGLLVVAGDHHDLEAHRLQPSDGRCGLRARRVRQTEQPNHNNGRF
jgi:hypothetical protein